MSLDPGEYGRMAAQYKTGQRPTADDLAEVYIALLDDSIDEEVPPTAPTGTLRPPPPYDGE